MPLQIRAQPEITIIVAVSRMTQLYYNPQPGKYGVERGILTVRSMFARTITSYASSRFPGPIKNKIKIDNAMHVQNIQ